MKVSLSLSLLALVISSASHAECTYKDAQQKLMESNNILHEYKKEQMDLIKNDQPIPAELNRKLDTINEALAANGIALSEIGDPTKITYETKVPNAICAEYDRIITTYTPSGYVKKEIVHNTSNRFHCEGIKDTELWERYGNIIQKQPALLQAGKITDKQALEITQLMSEFGANMTTDFPAACAYFLEAESKILSYEN